MNLDHKAIGQRLDLFHFSAAASGAAFWHPRGLAVVRALEEHVRRIVAKDGFEEVKGPQVLSAEVWKKSGHWEKFGDAMMRLDDNSCALKPVSCPGHIEIVKARKRRVRPGVVRLSELGLVHRDERRSQLLGLFRLRQFVQDDGHIFCAEDDIDEEVARFVERVRGIYASVGFDRIDAVISLRPPPERRAGSDALWDRAEAALERAVCGAGLSYSLVPGGGAFYGPKLEILVNDRRGRAWQCGTIQLDFVLPERFGLAHVMLHRAMLGSFERFLGLLLEQRGGHLPAWLSPEQVRVIPVAANDDIAAYAGEVEDRLRERGARASRDSRDVPLAPRIARAHEDCVPIAVVVGARDRAARRVAIRLGDERRELPHAEAIDFIASACAPPPI
jgi:threonyl-tRNA synthetase